jgi:SOCE-associated regulatory factor of calcium homoeostasis
MRRHIRGAKSTLLILSGILTLLTSLTSAARVTNPSKVPKNAVLLSKISTLTLRSGRSTSSRRVSPVPQLQCSGPSNVCALYEVDTMRCKNEGADYDDNNIQWTCSASLPEEFKLGSTDVMCEGYESSEDPYVLKGSCGVDYRLSLTDKGETKYGTTNDEDLSSSFQTKSKWEKLGTFLFWLIFVGVVVAIILSAIGCLGTHDAGGDEYHRRRRRGGGSGGGGGGGFNDDPPPPYSDYGPSPKPLPFPFPKTYTSSSSSRHGQTRSQGRSPNWTSRVQEAWRPGFWTGAGVGTAAGYALANRGSNQTDGGGSSGGGPSQTNTGRLSGRNRDNAGEGSSRSTSTPSFSPSRHQSTGFGSTIRR